MDSSLLLPLAIHSTDIITTKKLLCTIKYLFKDVNIWRLKYDYEFSDKKYLEFLSDYENYILHKINNFSLLIRTGDSPSIDNLLYEYIPVYDRLYDFVSDAIHYGRGCENGKFFKVDIKDRFVIFFSHACEDFNVIGYYPTMEDALNRKESSIKKCRDRKDIEDLDYFIVDLLGIKIYLIGDTLNDNKNKLKIKFYYDSLQ